MNQNNYEIMSGDTVVAIWQDGVLKVFNEMLLPMYLCRICGLKQERLMRIVQIPAF